MARAWAGNLAGDVGVGSGGADGVVNVRLQVGQALFDAGVGGAGIDCGERQKGAGECQEKFSKKRFHLFLGPWVQ